MSNSEPWHGQTYEEDVAFDTTHASCVHCAVTAMNDVALVRVTRNVPAVEATRAMPPVAASGELDTILTDTTPFATVAETVESGEPGIALMGLPLQPGSSAKPPVHAAADTNRLQN